MALYDSDLRKHVLSNGVDTTLEFELFALYNIYIDKTKFQKVILIFIF